MGVVEVVMSLRTAIVWLGSAERTIEGFFVKSDRDKSYVKVDKDELEALLLDIVNAGALVHDAIKKLEGMGKRRRSGHRRNPSLVVYNPPDLRVRRVGAGRVVGQIASNVHEIKYEHAEDGEPYVHEFSPGVKMFALDGRSHEVLLTSELPLWEDFS